MHAVVVPYQCPFCIFPPCPPCTAPSIVTAKTANFSAVSRPNAGITCLTPAAGIDPAAVGALVSPEASLGGSFLFGPFLAQAEVDATAADCSAGQFEVKTWTYDSSTPPQPTLTDGIAVSVIVP